jgi:hypothetical protein
MAETVSPRRLSEEARSPSQANPCEILMTKVVLGQVFSHYVGFSLSLVFHNYPIHHRQYIRLIIETVLENAYISHARQLLKLTLEMTYVMVRPV